jgi:hypothetical protein
MIFCFEAGLHYPHCTVAHAPCSADLREHIVESFTVSKTENTGRLLANRLYVQSKFFYDFVLVNGFREVNLVQQNGGVYYLLSRVLSILAGKKTVSVCLLREGHKILVCVLLTQLI